MHARKVPSIAGAYLPGLLCALLLLHACAVLQGAQPVVPKNPAEAFSVASLEIADLYDFNVELTLPIVEGATPVLTMDQGREVRKRIDALAEGLEVAYHVWLSQGVFQADTVDAVRKALISIRTQLERARGETNGGQ